MIQSVYMLSLDRRKDRWPAIEHSVNELLTLPLNKFIVGSGTDTTLSYSMIDSPSLGGHANAFLSHREMFARILAEGHNNVLLLEDDVYFIEDRFKTVYGSERFRDFWTGTKWDCLYLGWQQKLVSTDTDDIEQYEDGWKSSKIWGIRRANEAASSRISGLHGVVVTRKMLQILSQITYGPMDAYINQRLSQFSAWYVAPKILGASASYSYCENCWQDRSVLT